MINNRQNGNGNGNGRRRGRSGNAPRPNGGGGQPDRGSRLDNRARGNASQLHEKYKTLAADAQRQGDRVMTEYYLQFADHYFRVLSENRSRFEEQAPRRDRFDGQSDDYDENDGEAADGFDERPAPREQERGEADGNRNGYRERERQDRGDGNRDGGRQDRVDGNRDAARAERVDGNRDNARQDRGGGRQEGRGEPRDAGRADGNRFDNRGESVRGLEGPRVDADRDRQERGDERQPREPRPPRDGFEPRNRRPRDERQAGEQAPVVEPRPVTPEIVEATPVRVETPVAPAGELPLEAPVPERRPRGRPRKVAAPVESAAEAPVSERIEMDRLPPALSDAGDAPAAEAKPRRTRRPRGEAATV